MENHRSPSTSTFQKYFPNLPAPSVGEASFPGSDASPDLFRAHFSISRYTSVILPPSGHNCRAVVGEDKPRRGWRFFFRCGGPSFANISQSGATEACSTSEDSGEAVEGCAPAERTSGESSSSPKKKSSWDDMPKFLLAGAVSTILSRTFVAPLERIKLECIIQGPGQSMPEIVRWIWTAEGVRGFWKGNMLNLFRMIPFKSISFVCYDMYCDLLPRIQGKTEITNNDRLVGGGISGVAATVVCLPLDTIRTRLLAPGGDALGGVDGCFFYMVRNEGFLSLYKGLAPALISMGPSSAVFYAVYDTLKSCDLARRRKSRRVAGGSNELGILRTLIYGAIAGACAETVTYPLEVVRRQLQLQQSSRLGMASALSKMVARHGVASLFAGLLPSTLQVLPSASMSYLFYEMMKSILNVS